MNAQGGFVPSGEERGAGADAPPRSGPVVAPAESPGDAWRYPRPAFPWLGLTLVAVGIGALVGVFEPRISTDSSVILALGLIGLVALFVGRLRWIAAPAAVFASWGLARVLHDLGVVSGPGWTWVFVGAGLLALYLYGFVADEGHGWAIWPAALFLGIGAFEVAGQQPGLERLQGAWLPVLLVGLGLLLLVRGVTRPSAGGWRRW